MASLLVDVWTRRPDANRNMCSLFVCTFLQEVTQHRAMASKGFGLRRWELYWDPKNPSGVGVRFHPS